MKSTERAYPLRVIRVVLTERRALPVYPDKQTSSESVGMSQRCLIGGHALVGRDVSCIG
jgi:hypothetical protein